MDNKIPPKEICEDCKGAEDYWNGQFASDGSFYCSYCLVEYFKLQDSQEGKL